MATGPKLTNSEKDFQTLGFPIFGLAGFKDKLIVSGGVGAKNVGFQDQIIVFEQGLPPNKKIHQEELEYNLQFLTVSESRCWMGGSSDHVLYIFRILPEGKPVFRQKLEVDTDKANSRVVDKNLSETGVRTEF